MDELSALEHLQLVEPRIAGILKYGDIFRALSIYHWNGLTLENWDLVIEAAKSFGRELQKHSKAELWMILVDKNRPPDPERTMKFILDKL